MVQSVKTILHQQKKMAAMLKSPITIDVKKSDEDEYVFVTDSQFQQDKTKLAAFATAEELSHQIPYQAAENPNLNSCSLKDSDGVTREYDIKRIYGRNEGLRCYTLVGKDIDNPRVHITFRGTACKESVKRDLESYGAGTKTFFESEAMLMSQLNDIILSKPRSPGTKIKISVSGHSLGGADAQNFTTSILEAQTKNLQEQRKNDKRSSLKKRIGSSAKSLFSSCFGFRKKYKAKDIQPSERSGLNLIESIDLNTANSAGVSAKTATACKEALNFINDPLHRNDNIKINANLLHVGGDAVQQTGQTSILSDVDSKLAEVTLLKLDVGQQGLWKNPLNLVQAINGALGTKVAHTSFHFKGHEEVPSSLSYILLKNNNAYDAAGIKSHLQHKSKVDNSTFSLFFKRALRKMLEVGNKLLGKKKSLSTEEQVLLTKDNTRALAQHKPSSPIKIKLQRKPKPTVDTEVKLSKTTDDLDLLLPAHEARLGNRSSPSRFVSMFNLHKAVTWGPAEAPLVELEPKDKCSSYDRLFMSCMM